MELCEVNKWMWDSIPQHSDKFGEIAIKKAAVHAAFERVFMSAYKYLLSL